MPAEHGPPSIVCHDSGRYMLWRYEVSLNGGRVGCGVKVGESSDGRIMQEEKG